MNLASASVSQPVGYLRAPEPLKELLKVALFPATSIAENSIKLGRRPLKRLSDPARNRHLGNCVQCGTPVRNDHPFLRYHGEYYHTHGCIENQPPALTETHTQIG
jgi:hypothetical protein